MEILAPQLQWIGSRCYRVNPTREEASGSVADAFDTEPDTKSSYIEPDLYGGDNSGEDQDEYDIVLNESKRFVTSFHVPKPFYGLLIGAKGTTRKRIESETNTVLKVPNPGADGDIQVMGNLRQNVASARRRIELIVIGARAKQDATHFICIPVVQPNVRERYLKFKNEILGGSSVFGLDESIFQDSNKLHLTFGILALMDSHDLRLSTQLLSECQASIIRPIMQQFGTLDFRITGIEHMNDDPSEVHVLYGKVESEALQLIADGIVQCFVKHGLLQRPRESVKLHVTLINTRFRKNTDDFFDATNGDQQKPSSSAASNNPARLPFDSRDILRKYADYDFGKQPVSEVHISRRFTTNCIGGFYDASAVAKVY